jgi:hypothetical protein
VLIFLIRNLLKLSKMENGGADKTSTLFILIYENNENTEEINWLVFIRCLVEAAEIVIT